MASSAVSAPDSPVRAGVVRRLEVRPEAPGVPLRLVESRPFARIARHPLSRTVLESWRNAARASGLSSGGPDPRHSTGADVASVRSTPSPSMITAQKHIPRPRGSHRT